ncbi:hypothetical protein T12_2152 [Trichinella patagoniensis]|uniref:Uncharacterized protein n=1 Tax=Trichinella patagoniensis TaxID=990121 RepID=A0A0V0ZLI0_9BILA|nr:hypothetical protein T12_2152 [Trichinella patagoniensis]
MQMHKLYSPLLAVTVELGQVQEFPCTYSSCALIESWELCRRLLAVFVAPALLAALQFSPASDKRKATRNVPIVQLRISIKFKAFCINLCEYLKSLTKAGATSTEIGVSN